MAMTKARLGYLVAVVVFTAIVAVVILTKEQNPQLYTYSRILMGTVVEITLKEDNPRAAEAAFEEIARLEGLLSSYRKDSELSRINRAAPQPVKVSPEVFNVVVIALKLCALTGGAFDPTVGPLVELWGFKGGSGVVPTKEQIEERLGLVGCGAVVAERDSQTIALKRRGMELDTGGVAKGYIVDRAVDVLKEHGIGWAIVNAGGDVTLYSKDPSERFRVGIRHPEDPDGLLGTLSIGSGSVATSGDYERYFVKDGVRYHHILDPRTGMPARGIRSVTVVATEAYLSDGLATALFVMGKEAAVELVERLDGVDAVIVDEEGGLYVSGGLKDAFTKADGG